MQDKIFVTKSSMPDFDEYIDEIKDIWDSHILTNMGSKHTLFKNMLIKYMNVDNIELFTNGHMAIEMTLQAFEFPFGGEVITTPFTFASTTHAIVRNGLIPIFCDIDKDTYCIDADKIEALITDKTVAILPVHVYGNVCNVKKIQAIADKYGLKVIYDAAHTFGETYEGISIGMFGDASCFSFHATKVFNSIEGGAVCYRDEKIGQKLYDLKNFGIHGPEDVVSVGANAKMNEFCAAMGICNLRHIDEEIEKRSQVYSRYNMAFTVIPGIKLNYIQSGLVSNFSYYPIVIDSEIYGITRDCLFDKLAEQGIIARKYFYPLVNDFECYRDRYSSETTPVAKDISEKVLTIPMYADLIKDNQDKIIDIIKHNAT